MIAKELKLMADKANDSDDQYLEIISIMTNNAEKGNYSVLFDGDITDRLIKRLRDEGFVFKDLSFSDQRDSYSGYRISIN